MEGHQARPGDLNGYPIAAIGGGIDADRFRLAETREQRPDERAAQVMEETRKRVALAETSVANANEIIERTRAVLSSSHARMERSRSALGTGPLERFPAGDKIL